MSPYCPHCGHECSPRDLEQRDNSFRGEPSADQVSLDDLAEEVTEGPDGSVEVTMEIDDESVWDRIKSGSLEDHSISFEVDDSPPPEPGDVINDQDPHQW